MAAEGFRDVFGTKLSSRVKQDAKAKQGRLASCRAARFSVWRLE
jgi:hypothetical protein